MAASVDPVQGLPGEAGFAGAGLALGIHLSTQDGSAVLAVAGEVDAATVDQFRTALLDAQHSPRVVVDLSGVTFMDSTGINALVGAYHRMPQNGELRVVGLRSNVQRVFEITGLDVVFTQDGADDGRTSAPDS